jgi:hypothetical protein
VGVDGRLHGRFWTGAIDVLSSRARVDDGSWHHLVLVGGGDSQVLYVDGVPADARPGRPAHDRMKEAQLGAGTSAGWPQAAPGAVPFLGELGDFVLEDRPLSADEARRLFALGPPE